MFIMSKMLPATKCGSERQALGVSNYHLSL